MTTIIAMNAEDMVMTTIWMRTESGQAVVLAVLTIHWKEIMTMNGEKDTCATCSHFIGGGDWNLCCDLKYDLCYSCTPKCDKYKERKEVQKSE